MVRALHQAGIEVILDVVYNHTAEGNHLGPTLSFRGVDNQAYYRLVDGDPRHYYDTTGTGNSLNVRHHDSLRLVMDSLRYWVLEMHVDGFRFDLASALAREFHEVDRLSAFFDLVNQDPVVVPGEADRRAVGRRRGRLPGRRLPVACGRSGTGSTGTRCATSGGAARGRLGEFALRFTGSSDLYEADNRRPIASINFVTAHDGFTLNDLVSYNEKHNAANGEDNRDGESHNRSWNCGAEGPTEDGEVNVLRERQKRNFLATLLLSQGVPMIAHGDELGRTQQGNNNVYCQDNELSWIDWTAAREHEVLTEFTARLAALRREHPVFRRQRFFQGRPIRGSSVDDIAWLRPDGRHMTERDWTAELAPTIAIFLNGRGIPDRNEIGERIVDDSFLLLINAHHEPVTFTLPSESYGRGWEIVLDTADPLLAGIRRRHPLPGGRQRIPARAMRVLQCRLPV